jgi:hypothetical protein
MDTMLAVKVIMNGVKETFRWMFCLTALATSLKIRGTANIGRKSPLKASKVHVTYPTLSITESWNGLSVF